MKVKGIITLLCATESGVSKATGNPWTCKEVVIEIADDRQSTMALKTFNDDAVKVLERCKEGDEIEADVYAHADYREFPRKNGTIGSVRSTDLALRSVELTKESGF